MQEIHMTAVEGSAVVRFRSPAVAAAALSDVTAPITSESWSAGLHLCQRHLWCHDGYDLLRTTAAAAPDSVQLRVDFQQLRMKCVDDDGRARRWFIVSSTRVFLFDAAIFGAGL